MCGLSTESFSSGDLLRILYCNSSLSILKKNNKYDHSNNDCQNNQYSKSTGRKTLALHKLIEQCCHITWHTRENVDYKYDRNTISHAFFCNSLTNPHKECRSCSQRQNYDRSIYKIIFFQQSLTTETNRHSGRFNQCKHYRKITGKCHNLLSSVFTFFLHFL